MEPPGKIRVLVNGPLPPPVGGMATYCEDYLRTELKDRFSVTQCEAVVIKRLFHATRGVVQFPVRVLNSVLIVLAWVCMLAVKRPHIAHLHTGSSPGFYVKSVMGLLAKAVGAKPILHIHGARFDEFYRGSGPLMRRLITRLLNRNVAVIALSRQWRDFLLGAGVLPEKVVVMPNSVFVPALSPPPERGGAVSVLFMSAFENRKGIDEIVGAFEHEPALRGRCRIIMAGPRADEWQRIRNRVDRQGLAEVIEMPGSLVGEAKDAAYRDADVYLLPSYAEGMPIGLLEAMSYGLACVTTPVGGIPDVITDGENGLLVPPGDVDALAGAIKQLVEDPDLRRRLGEAARRTIEKEFDWGVRAKQISALYHRLVGVTLSEDAA